MSLAAAPALPTPAHAPGPAVLRPNLFAIPFGFAGLAGCWSAAERLTGTPAWVTDAWWALATAVLLVVAPPYLRQLARRGLAVELADPTFGPFLSLPATLVMLLGVALARVAPDPGRVVFVVGLVVCVVVGSVLSGQWVRGDVPLERWHPGYLLPTVAGGLVAALGAGTLGLDRLGRLMFGYGIVYWLILSSVVLARLVTRPALPLALRPTLAIEVAPPALAVTTWFALDGARVDAVALGLSGFALLMVGVQVRLAGFLHAAPFGPGSWAFSFTYAQVLVAGLRWLSVTGAPGRAAWAWAVLAVATVGLTALAARTVVGLVRGTFLPRPESG